MNFRIDFASSIKESRSAQPSPGLCSHCSRTAQDHLARAIAVVAKKNNLTFASFPSKNESTDLGDRYAVAEVFGIPLEPAPYTPEVGGVFDMFAGTIK